MEKKDKYNSSGCLDMTAFLAMRNIEREERARSKQDKRQAEEASEIERTHQAEPPLTGS